MKEVDLTPGLEKYSHPSDRAVMYFLRRMCHDGQLNWFMTGTGAYDEMLAAGAAVDGVDLEVFRAEHRKRIARPVDPGQAAVRDNCACCGKVNPDEIRSDCDNCETSDAMADLLRRALDLLTAMTRDPADASLPEKIEDLLEDVKSRFSKFAWRQAGGIYWAATDADTFLLRMGDVRHD